MSRASRKRVNAAMRERNKHPQRPSYFDPIMRPRVNLFPGLAESLRVPPRVSPDLLSLTRLMTGKHDGTMQRGTTPQDCQRCNYKSKDMEIEPGTWCYMFREMPAPTCAQFTPVP